MEKKVKPHYTNEDRTPIKQMRLIFADFICKYLFNLCYPCSIVFLVLVSSCAQIVAPGGGIKDETPPRVVKYSPDSAQLNFKSRSIEITFDEFVHLQDLNNQLIISPPMENTPEINLKNKKLIIDLNKKDSLKPNTTYCISFGNAIQDFNENNPSDNFRYIFSTGSYIDSLMVKGKVENAFDHKTEKGILVMLYSDLSDSVVYKKLPEYFAKTKEDGTFQINNIRNGNYKIVALKDVNANYKYDGESEMIGFVDTLVNPNEKKNILIELFQEPAKKIFLKKQYHYSYGKVVLVFNQGSDSIKVTNLSKDLKGVQELFDYSKNKDTLTYWIANYQKDSLKLLVSNGNKVLDTVEFKMIKKEDALNSKRSPLKLSVVSSPNGNQGFDLDSEIKLVFNHPISLESKFEKFIFKQDSLAYVGKKGSRLDFLSEGIFSFVLCAAEGDSLGEIIFKKGHPNEAVPNFLSINKLILLKENTNYHLFIPPATFTDIFGLTNDTIKIDFKTKEEKFYGVMKLKVNVPETKGNYIVQLLDEKESVVRENTIKKTETISYTYLYPQKYKLKIVVDENNNGKWDSGNYLKNIPPEKVIYNRELTTIRSNWDLDLDWIVGGK